KRDAAVDERIQEPCIDRDRLIETGKRLSVARQGLENAAAIIRSVRRVGIDLQRFGDQPLGFLELSGLRMQIAEQVKRVEILGVDAQDLAAQPDGLGAVPDLLRAPRSLNRKGVHDATAPSPKCAGG